MVVNYDKVIEEEIPMFERCMEKALAFIKNKYPHLCFCGLKINLNSRAGGSNFRASKSKGWQIKVSCRHTMYFYDRKNCGLTTPRKGIETGVEIDATITILHELTHYAQGVLGSGVYSEIDTTKNSIEYLKMYHPDIYSKLIETKVTKRPLKTNLEKIYEEINNAPLKIIEMPKEEKIIPQEIESVHHFIPEKKEADTKGKNKINPISENKDEVKLNALLAKRKVWETKHKRAENAIKKLNKRIKYYNKKIKK